MATSEKLNIGQRMPIILPRNNVTKMIMREMHQQMGHMIVSMKSIGALVPVEWLRPSFQPVLFANG